MHSVRRSSAGSIERLTSIRFAVRAQAIRCFKGCFCRFVHSIDESTAMPTEQIETLIIGGGQAGLAMSHMLSQRGCPHLLVERCRIAERWRTERWKGLRFQFPNWSVRLPDFPFPHTDPGAFATSDEILDFIVAYADFIAAPVRCGVTVTALRRRGGLPGFVAETSVGPIEAANVVVPPVPTNVR
jgi:putative flavoprotein involved in K+ transport